MVEEGQKCQTIALLDGAVTATKKQTLFLQGKIVCEILVSRKRRRLTITKRGNFEGRRNHI